MNTNHHDQFYCDQSDEYRAACPLCERVILKSDVDEALEVVANHNDARHGGDQVAHVVGEFREDLDEFMDYVKSEHGSSVCGDFGAHIVRTDAWGAMADLASR